MVNKIYAIWFASCANTTGGSKVGGIKEYLLNVGFILTLNNGGKPSFSLNFDHIMIKSIHYALQNSTRMGSAYNISSMFLNGFS